MAGAAAEAGGADCKKVPTASRRRIKRLDDDSSSEDEARGHAGRPQPARRVLARVDTNSPARLAAYAPAHLPMRESRTRAPTSNRQQNRVPSTPAAAAQAVFSRAAAAPAAVSRTARQLLDQLLDHFVMPPSECQDQDGYASMAEDEPVLAARAFDEYVDAIEGVDRFDDFEDMLEDEPQPAVPHAFDGYADAIEGADDKDNCATCPEAMCHQPSPPASPPSSPASLSPPPAPPPALQPDSPQIPPPPQPPPHWEHAQPLSKARRRRLCAVADLVREAASSEERKADRQSKAVDRNVRRAAGTAFVDNASQDGNTPANETASERQQRLAEQPQLRAAAAAGHDGRAAAEDDAAAFVDIINLPLAPIHLDRHAASLEALRDGDRRDARADRSAPSLALGAWHEAESPSHAGHWLPKLVEQTKRRALQGAARGDEAASTVINAAPTGAAATLLWQGRTVHSLVSPPQIKSADRDKAQMSDYPLSSDKMAVLRAALGTELAGLRTAVLNLDERSMFDHELAGWTSWRLGEATGLTHQRGYTCGGIPVVLWFGDLGQLPKSGEGLHAKLKAGELNPASVTGSFLYQQGFSGAVVLNQTMRQAADQQELLQRLLAIREGRVTQAHVDAIKARLESAQTDEYRDDFRRRRVMTGV